MNKLLKRLAPMPLISLVRRAKLIALRRRFSQMSVEAAFSEIYKSQLWGADSETGYCSGSGSRGRNAAAYVNFVRSYIDHHQIRSVVDLGCGDFFIGAKIAKEVESYVGIDVVQDLIRNNNEIYASKKVSFLCKNIVTDPLPPGELCLIRQVFQHLSNSEIANVLKKLSIYKHVLITEHYPAPSTSIVPNKDKPHGPDTRIVDNSGVYLDRPPFCVPVELVFSVPADPCLVAEGEAIRTFAILRKE